MACQGCRRAMSYAWKYARSTVHPKRICFDCLKKRAWAKEKRKAQRRATRPWLFGPPKPVVESLLRRCSKCKRTKPRGNFYRYWSTEKGRFRRRSWCLECEKGPKAARMARRKFLERGWYTGEDVQRKISEQRGMCGICFKPLLPDFHVDHIVPIARGGSNTAGNIQVVHAKCNLRKGAKLQYFPRGVM
jgi:5-methylcytosine-specific restriction endonuclease McrA